MKKILILSMLVLLLSSCEGLDRTTCLNSVKEAFPNSKIYKSPKNDFRFFVIDSLGRVTYVETMNVTNTRISEYVILKPVE